MPPELEYYCRKCKRHHRFTSKIYNKHAGTSYAVSIYHPVATFSWDKIKG